MVATIVLVQLFSAHALNSLRRSSSTSRIFVC